MFHVISTDKSELLPPVIVTGGGIPAQDHMISLRHTLATYTQMHMH